MTITVILVGKMRFLLAPESIICYTVKQVKYVRKLYFLQVKNAMISLLIDDRKEQIQ